MTDLAKRPATPDRPPRAPRQMRLRNMAARDRLNRIGLSAFASVVALVVAVLLTSVVLEATHHNAYDTLKEMIDYGTGASQIAVTINAATTYYLAAIAVAIGFRMNLFNIGVDGQYQLAALLAAAFGGQFALPNGLHQLAIVAVAMAVGAAWAGIVGVLKVTRGVSEVISSIMLNFIAGAVIAYLFKPGKLGVLRGNDITTKPIDGSGQVRGLDIIPGSDTKVYGLVILAIVVGVGFQLLVSRTRFGFDLRATGRSASAAQASGVNVKKMIIIAMLLSGAVAGLINLPVMLGEAHNYSLNTPSGIGFTGVAIALLGRNNPVGIAFAALLWGFLDTSVLILQVSNVPIALVLITEGIIVFSAVIAFELVRRYALRLQQRRVGRVLADVPAGAEAAA